MPCTFPFGRGWGTQLFSPQGPLWWEFSLTPVGEGGSNDWTSASIWIDNFCGSCPLCLIGIITFNGGRTLCAVYKKAKPFSCSVLIFYGNKKCIKSITEVLSRWPWKRFTSGGEDSPTPGGKSIFSNYSLWME